MLCWVMWPLFVMSSILTLLRVEIPTLTCRVCDVLVVPHSWSLYYTSIVVPVLWHQSRFRLYHMTSVTQHICIVSGSGPLQIGIWGGLPVGNPYYWPMLSLVIVKNILHLKMSYEKLLRILLTPYLVSLYLWVTLPWFSYKRFAFLPVISTLGFKWGWVVSLVFRVRLYIHQSFQVVSVRLKHCIYLMLRMLQIKCIF